MNADEVNAVRWADLSEGSRRVLLGARPINVAYLRALVGRGFTDELGDPTERGLELIEWWLARVAATGTWIGEPT